MNRIEKTFEDKQNILNLFCTAGYPNLHDLPFILEKMQEYGADMAEIGIPFSDPMADGVVIQESSHVALENGMTLHLLFEQLQNIRKKIHIPLILMGYLNPIFQMGIENFLKKCAEVEIDGVILPDLPLELYEKNYKEIFEKYNISLIFLMTPETSAERLEKIDNLSKGFIYAVSSSSTTGKTQDFSTHQIEYFQKIKNLSLKNPILIGFGIHNASTFGQVCQYAQGGIIGSAFLKKLMQAENLEYAIKDFIESVR